MLATRYPNHIGHFMSNQKRLLKHTDHLLIRLDRTYMTPATIGKRPMISHWNRVKWTSISTMTHSQEEPKQLHSVCTVQASYVHSLTACPDKPVSANTRNEGPVHRALQAKEHLRPECGLFNSYKGNTCTHILTYVPFCKFAHRCATC